MSSVCGSYFSVERAFVEGFTCPKADNDAAALFCCGFNDLKYCCDDSNNFFLYKYGYMWWLSFGALVGLSIAVAGVLAIVVSLCVLCYVVITSKPRELDNGLELQATTASPYLHSGKLATGDEMEIRLKMGHLASIQSHLKCNTPQLYPRICFSLDLSSEV